MKEYNFSQDIIHQHIFSIKAKNKKEALKKLKEDPHKYDKIDYPDTILDNFLEEKNIR